MVVLSSFFKPDTHTDPFYFVPRAFFNKKCHHSLKILHLRNMQVRTDACRFFQLRIMKIENNHFSSHSWERERERFCRWNNTDDVFEARKIVCIQYDTGNDGEERKKKTPLLMKCILCQQHNYRFPFWFNMHATIS